MTPPNSNLHSLRARNERNLWRKLNPPFLEHSVAANGLQDESWRKVGFWRKRLQGQIKETQGRELRWGREPDGVWSEDSQTWRNSSGPPWISGYILKGKIFFFFKNKNFFQRDYKNCTLHKFWMLLCQSMKFFKKSWNVQLPWIHNNLLHFLLQQVDKKECQPDMNLTNLVSDPPVSSKFI